MTDLELLRGTPLAYGLNADELLEIEGCLRPFQAAAGETLVRENDVADRWYLIAEGTAEVTHVDLLGQPVSLAILGPGDSFGERALLAEPLVRTATVTARTSLTGFAIDRSDFRANVSTAFALRERLTQRLDVMAIDTALKRASPFASLPHEALQSLAQALQSQRVATGEVVIRESDDGDCLYLIRSGAMRVTQRERAVAVLHAGDSFGEVSLLTGKPRNATVTAIERTDLLALKRDDFLSVAHQYDAVAAYFRELIGARLRGAVNQPLLLPDPVSTIMPRLGVRARKRYWAFLLAGIALFGLLTLLAQHTDRLAAIYAVTIVGALVVPVVFVQYLAESDILAERPLELLATGMLGAGLGLPLAMWVQQASGILPGSLLSAFLIATIEEPAKLLGVLWLLRRPELRFRMDGVIIGAAAGMGFSALETMLYGLARIETVGVLVGVLWFRALLAPLSHGTWTAIVAAMIWREHSTGLRRASSGITGGLVLVIGLHTLWDWVAWPVPLNFVWLLLVGTASVLTLRIVLHRAAQEEAYSVAALAPELARTVGSKYGVRCSGCGRIAPAGARYCPRCGLALHAPTR